VRVIYSMRILQLRVYEREDNTCNTKDIVQMAASERIRQAVQWLDTDGASSGMTTRNSLQPIDILPHSSEVFRAIVSNNQYILDPDPSYAFITLQYIVVDE